jgi:Ca2+ transporting ATPase
MSGSGKAVVCAVGKNQQIQAILDKHNVEDEEEDDLTPLQQRLERIAGQVGAFGYKAAIIIFLAQLAFYAFKCIVSKTDFLSSETVVKLLDFFTTALTIIIVAVPEGLPLAVSISMAFSIDTMKKDNLLVKNIEAVETMGTIGEICTGKTGTLTKNQMSVNSFYTARGMVTVREGYYL